MLKRVLLAVSLTSFVFSFFNVGSAPQWDVARPLGAVFFILYMIVMMLEKETALYDEEHAHAPEPVRPAQPAPLRQAESQI